MSKTHVVSIKTATYWGILPLLAICVRVKVLGTLLFPLGWYIISVQWSNSCPYSNGGRTYQLEPHKAVAEVSKIGNLEERFAVGRANPLMDRKVVGASAYLSVYLSACVTS